MFGYAMEITYINLAIFFKKHFSLLVTKNLQEQFFSIWKKNLLLANIASKKQAVQFLSQELQRVASLHGIPHLQQFLLLEEL